MKKGCCILGVLAVILTAYPAFMFFSHQHYYGEAEPLADRLAVISRHLSTLRSQNQKVPATVQELLQFLPEEDQKRFTGHHIIWEPEGDPMLKMRANQKYGFVISREAEFRWISESEELVAFFPDAD